ncbi:hypothetical protein RFI_28502 [Reticulomyxa filosa]|uniref:DNA polymerase n=1 Tax=Reticulomyxa filosa TaxID=46433 RepID=X6M4R8_RETFI|nr:hypothetical protein RFI_28502 [Reticulomyxa filosa]|eukprot:ETO08884.1 hypothetical protein RFI_28502 [Reticulomyxa filosa]
MPHERQDVLNKKVLIFYSAEMTQNESYEEKDTCNWEEFVRKNVDRGRRVPTEPNEDLILQHVDTDLYVGFVPGYDGERDTRLHRPVIRIYGIDKQGQSVLIHIYGFCPYFFVQSWGFDESQAEEMCERLQKALEFALSSEKSSSKYDVYVPKVCTVEKQSLWGCQFGQNTTFLKIYVTVPTLVPTCRGILQVGVDLGPGIGLQSFDTYESNVPFLLRYMIDADLYGSAWFEVEASQYSVVPKNEMVSHCSMEVIVAWTDVKPLSKKLSLHWDVDSIAPLRLLSFDIECQCSQGFPEATNDSDKVIQIANVLKIEGQKDFCYQTVFCLGSCAPIPGCHVRSFETERDLLLAWVQFVQKCDPDILTGYNIVNFDLPYLLNRAAHMGIADFPYLGRIRTSKARIKDSMFSSRAYGTSASKDITIEGRIQMDLFPLIRREHRLRSYSLNNVAFHFLQQSKEDVHYSIIGDLQNGNDQTRRRLAVYCLKDAMLPVRLNEQLMILINQIEMARVTGVPITFLITRGQQIKVLSQIYRKAKVKGYLIPYRKMTGDEETFDGAIVIPPQRGYYVSPITTLDFASLYPSIMMAHNLCYTTMANRHDALTKLNDDQSRYTLTPTGNYFVKPCVQKGLLPEILEELLAARAATKKAMKETTDPSKQSVLNGRQLALKITANSVYGFTGATVGSLPCFAISSSVTGFGREMIERAKEIVESEFNMSKGYEHNAQVIYGDTDSVMVKFGTNEMKTAMELGRKAAELVTSHFQKPIRLEFEKVYMPYLLMNKKRYAGMLWTKSDKWDYMDAKGIETVRRDNCELVKTVVQKVLDYILIEKDVLKAEQFTKSIISKLLQNKIDMSLLVITKALGKIDEYKVKTAHVELVQRMRKRDSATAPKVGDRVAYVIIKGPKNAKAYERVEDPLYALENGIPLDSEYYLTHQLKEPLKRIFEPILGEKINSLFSGRHTRAITVSTSRVGAMSKFTVVRKTCAGCKVNWSGVGSVCDHCKGKEPQLYMKQMALVRLHEQNFNSLWTQCQRCQGSLTQEVLCSNRDCPIFYRRTKVKKDLENAQRVLAQFSL